MALMLLLLLLRGCDTLEGASRSIGSSTVIEEEDNSIDGRYIVHLCEEGHRSRVARHVAERHADTSAFTAKVHKHLTNLPALPAIILHDTSTHAARELIESELVCDVSPVLTRSKLGAPTRRLDEVPIKSKEAYWNLDRINQRELPLDGDASFQYTGAGVNIVVLDTGMDTEHVEFTNGGREVLNVASYARTGFDGRWKNWPSMGWSDTGVSTAEDRLNNDRDGHGTHCTGTAGGETVGVAPGANIYHMKILDDRGGGSTDWEIEAMDDIAGLVREGKLTGPTVMSISVGGKCKTGRANVCRELDPEALAIESLTQLDVLVVVAAGNSNDDACFYLPAASKDAITVAASNILDKQTSWSNWGPCIDIVAPGAEIPSASTNEGGFAYDDDYFVDDVTQANIFYSGTSQATPAVAGVLALFAEKLGSTVGAYDALMNAAVPEIDPVQKDACETNFLLLQTPPEEADTSAFSTNCADSKDRPGWPALYDPKSSYSYYFECRVRCIDCQDLFETDCGGWCQEEEADVLYDMICDYSYAYNDDDDDDPCVGGTVLPRITQSELIEDDECRFMTLKPSKNFEYDHFVFWASDGTFVQAEGADYSLTDTSFNKDDLIIVRNDIDVCTESVELSLCNTEGEALSVDYGVYLVSYVTKTATDPVQGFTNRVTLDYQAQLSGMVEVAGDCLLSAGEELWEQEAAWNGALVSAGDYFSVTGASEDPTNCEVAFTAGDFAQPTYSPTPLYVKVRASFTVSGVTLEDARENVMMFKRAIASELGVSAADVEVTFSASFADDVEVSASSRRRLEEGVRVDYEVETRSGDTIMASIALLTPTSVAAALTAEGVEAVVTEINAGVIATPPPTVYESSGAPPSKSFCALLLLIPTLLLLI